MATMDEILTRLGLSGLCASFEAEKISPDIIGKLAVSEFQQLGVTNRGDMMALRTACVHYGGIQPQRVNQVCSFSRLWVLPGFL